MNRQHEKEQPPRLPEGLFQVKVVQTKSGDFFGVVYLELRAVDSVGVGGPVVLGEIYSFVTKLDVQAGKEAFAFLKKHEGQLIYVLVREKEIFGGLNEPIQFHQYFFGVNRRHVIWTLGADGDLVPPQSRKPPEES